MGSLCSIFHSRFKNLTKAIPSARKAQLMDYILLGWQTSKYKLKNSEQKWFMKHYDEIVEDTHIKRSTLERYIKELDDEGLIIRRRARYSRTNELGEFEVKTGTYIHPTEKLLNLLKPKENEQPTQEQTDDNSSEQPNDTPIDEGIRKPDCSAIDKNEGTSSLETRELYIRDLYSTSLINNISFKQLNLSVDNQTLKRLISQFETIQKLFDEKIKEEIPSEVKKLVLGTFFNLTFKHKVFFSSPEQIAAEYLYALINVEFYMPQVKSFKFRNNILSKLMREKRWSTPKGFYKHFYLGQNFKDKQKLREERWQEEKNKEISGDYEINIDDKDERLTLIEEKITNQSQYIEALRESIYEQSSEESILIIRQKIETAREELELLWEQQSSLENEIERSGLFNDARLCA